MKNPHRIISSFGETACKIIETCQIIFANVTLVTTSDRISSINFLGYKNCANNSFNDRFFFNTELIQPCGKIVFKVESVYSKDICYLNVLLRLESLGLYFIIRLTFLLT